MSLKFYYLLLTVIALSKSFRHLELKRKEMNSGDLLEPTEGACQFTNCPLPPVSRDLRRCLEFRTTPQHLLAPKESQHQSFITTYSTRISRASQSITPLSRFSHAEFTPSSTATRTSTHLKATANYSSAPLSVTARPPFTVKTYSPSFDLPAYLRSSCRPQHYSICLLTPSTLSSLSDALSYGSKFIRSI
jgi:hypothetical protein